MRYIHGIDIQQALEGNIRTHENTLVFAGCLILEVPETFHAQFLEFLRTFQDYTQLCGCRFAFNLMRPEETRALIDETGFAVRYCLLSYCEKPSS